MRRKTRQAIQNNTKPGLNMAGRIIVANSFPIYLYSDKTNGQALGRLLHRAERHIGAHYFSISV